ncbi:LuxR C-terminal-related transcriptional regulator [Myxococcus sp. RHSTA-1-4]|uniref:helix-turn-helix transcriptional regulator n=1 Tax=Myxococcus sp. RHSTA-1-4 TaxID=2874601 RepID=UPI001CC03EB3|nr:LuxR C-terminal-related transcriptional regulator [Myxococcus sp. RHSTA-1-4]MBZ4416317.1 LuxR C-terminal-related transcriptional regulator [Myxococcus sp. RHSTA-1-4]
MKPSHLRGHQVRALVRLLNEAHELPESQGERPRHLLSGMRRILGATCGACVLDRDFGPGGRGDFVSVVLEGWDGTTLPTVEFLARAGSAFQPAIRALMHRNPEPAALVTTTRRELVDDRGWYGAPFVEHHLGPAHLDDSLYSIRRSDEPSVVQGIGFYRERNERPFDDADRELLHLFHAECGAMFDTPEPAGDDALRAGLAPRERQTLELLLRGLTDKEIAGQLGISRFTVNQYTKSIYRRFGVQSRTALLARLLGRPAPASRARMPAS